MEHDFALKMRDDRKYNGIVSLNPVTPWNRGIPDGTLSCLDKFEAPDPADRVSKGYAIVNAGSKGFFFRGGIYAGDLLDNLIVKCMFKGRHGPRQG